MWLYWETYLYSAFVFGAVVTFGVQLWRRKLTAGMAWGCAAIALLSAVFGAEAMQRVNTITQLQARLPQAAQVSWVDEVFLSNNAYLEVSGCRVTVEYDLRQAHPLNLSTMHVARWTGSQCSASDDELRRLLTK